MKARSPFVCKHRKTRATRVSHILLTFLSGVLLLFGASVSCAQSSQSGLVGQWSGILIINGMRLHLSVDISQAADGKLNGELTSLDQANAKVPIPEIDVVGRAVHMSLPKIQGTYDALLDPGQKRMEGDWTQNGPGIGSGHWATIIASGGTARLPDRFAIDWVKLGDDGKTFTGDPGDNRNYHAFGQPVLAVADGSVSVMDGIPQNSPGSHAVKITPENVCGNSVSIKIASGQYAFYCHMQAGSLRVRPGDRVHKGQIMGLVGNAGDSSEPHLHFQLSDANSIAGSEGLPYVLDSFESQNASESPVAHRSELPLRDQRIRFPE